MRPSEVRIHGQTYKIRYDYNSVDDYGLTEPDKNLIWIRGSLPKQKIIRVFMHEIGHAIIAESPLSDKETFTNEEVCDIIGFMITDFHSANPDVWEWFQSK